MSKARSYVFTFNNPTVFDYSKIECKFLIVGNEIAPETKTLHHQGYIMFKSSMSFNSVKAKLPTGSHIEVAKGSPQQNIAYCSKESIFYEFGDRPKMGKRNDIIAVKEAIAEGHGMRHIIDLTNSYQSWRAAEFVLKYKERERNWKPVVKWYYGPSGSGKSKQAYSECKDPWTSLNDLQWWQGYDAHEHVILDDFRSHHCSFSTLLRILDRYPFVVQNKGGSRQLLARLIIITTCRHPLNTYNTTEDVSQLIRRIDEIREFALEVDNVSPVRNVIDALGSPSRPERIDEARMVDELALSVEPTTNATLHEHDPP